MLNYMADPDKKTRQNVSWREGGKRTVVIRLVRVVSAAPLWKDSVFFCIAGPRLPMRDDLKICGSSMAGYRVVCLFRTRSVYLCSVVGTKLSVVANPRRRPRREKESGGWGMWESGSKREGAMATRYELDQETGWSLDGSGICIVLDIC